MSEQTVEISDDLKKAAASLADALNWSDESTSYRRAVERVETDPDFARLRRELGAAAQSYNAAHADGTLTHEQIMEVQQLQQLVQFHEVNEEFRSAEERVKNRFAACNEAISERLGFDFARIAAPQSGGCGSC